MARRVIQNRVFYARRKVSQWTFELSPDVEVSANPNTTYGWGEVCLPHFKTVFGFTPRRGKTYMISLNGMTIEKVD